MSVFKNNLSSGDDSIPSIKLFLKINVKVTHELNYEDYAL